MQMIRQVINIIMGVLYTGIGVFVFWTEWFISELNPAAAKILGILFIVYGIFRIYRGLQAIRNQNF